MSLGISFKKIAPHQSCRVLLDTMSNIRAIFGVQFESQKVDKKTNLHEN